MDFASTGLSVFDKIMLLINSKKAKQQKQFERFVQEIYDDMKLITEDYMKLHMETLSQVQTLSYPLSSVKAHLETRRMDLYTLREKMRGITSLDMYDDGDMSLFANGIHRVLQCHLDIVSDEHSLHVTKQEIYSHTILGLIRRFEFEPDLNEENFRRKMAAELKLQLQGLEEAWADVCTGYARLLEKATV